MFRNLWHPPLTNEAVMDLPSPALVVDRDALDENVQRMIETAGGTARIRPHCKTHKMQAVAERQVAAGLTRFKAATIAEAEMLLRAGATDVILAYPVVGPNIVRVLTLASLYPGATLSVLADDEATIRRLGEVVAGGAATSLNVLVDVDCGMQRTGVPLGNEVVTRYVQLAKTPGLNAAGLHVYDGHSHQGDVSLRRQAVQETWRRVQGVRDQIVAQGLPVPEIVCGGTNTFPLWKQIDDPTVSLSPGTCILHDAGYAEKFPDMVFQPAAWVLGRVVSKPGTDRVTLDLGHKAVSPDQPVGRRVYFPQLPEAEQVLHSEEHLVLVTPARDHLRVGDVVWGIPRHVCTTVPLYADAVVASKGAIVETWEVTARNRRITV